MRSKLVFPLIGPNHSQHNSLVDFEIFDKEPKAPVLKRDICQDNYRAHNPWLKALGN